MLRPVWQNLRIGSKSQRSCMTKGRVLGRLVGLVGLVGRGAGLLDFRLRHCYYTIWVRSSGLLSRTSTTSLPAGCCAWPGAAP